MKFYLLVTLTFWIQVFGGKLYRTYDLRLAPELFEKFQKHYNKTYTDEEKKTRFKIFKSNLKKVNALNQNVKPKWIAVIGPYNDLTYEEFINKYDLPRFEEDGNEDRNVLTCTKEKLYLFKRFSQYTKRIYDRWGSWKAPEEYEDTDEALNDYHNEQNEYY